MTISELKKFWWYRFLKVIYIVMYVLALYSPISGSIQLINHDFDSWVTVAYIPIVIILVIVGLFEGVKRIFYYVVTGSWFLSKS